MLRLGLALSLLGLSVPVPVRAFEPGTPSTAAADGSVLRLVAGMQGIDAAESNLTPGLAPGEPRAEPPAQLDWIDPHNVRAVEHGGAQGSGPADGFQHPASLGWTQNTTGRHVGLGEPLEGESWLNRPLHAGWFIGLLDADRIIDGRLRQDVGFFGGYRVGWDFDHYWGVESRLGGATVGLDDPADITGARTGDILLWDTSVLYYPWGDARWRPYGTIGIGLANFDFVDELDIRHDEQLFGLPLGFGLKYRYNSWLTLRMEMLDNIAFGSAGLEAMHNLSLTTGVEIRFGGTRASYWPWNPNRYIW